MFSLRSFLVVYFAFKFVICLKSIFHIRYEVEVEVCIFQFYSFYVEVLLVYSVVPISAERPCDSMYTPIL